jgi:hypothetical protein
VTPAQLEKAVLDLQAELRMVSRTLGILIVWVREAAHSPLTPAAAQQLLEMLPPES